MPKAKAKAVAKSKSTAPTRAKAKAKAKAKAGPKAQTNSKKKGESRAEDADVETKQPPLFFWKETEPDGGFLSPWFCSPYSLYGEQYESVGHLIMVEKALLFDDQETVKRMLAAKGEDELKALGSSIKKFDDGVWREEGLILVIRANYSKFFRSTISEDLKKWLVDTGQRELVYASPSDAFWGIGFGAVEAEKTSRELWGQNHFGKALTEVREKVIAMKNPNRFAMFDTPGSRLRINW